MVDDKKTLKFQMMMSPGEARELDDWMFKNRIRSRAEAIRRLCSIALHFEGALVPSAQTHLRNIQDAILVDTDELIDLLEAAPEGDPGNETRTALLLSIDTLMRTWDMTHMLLLNLTEANYVIAQVKGGPQSTLDSQLRKFHHVVDKARVKVTERLEEMGYTLTAPADPKE